MRNEVDREKVAAAQGIADQSSDALGRPPAGPPESFIGPGVRLAGTLRCEHDFAIRGHLEGQVEAAGEVVVERGAVVEGDIKAAVIWVRGQTHGILMAGARIILEDGCEHRGGLRGPELVVEPGALLGGEVKVGSGSPSGSDPHLIVMPGEG